MFAVPAGWRLTDLRRHGAAGQRAVSFDRVPPVSACSEGERSAATQVGGSINSRPTPAQVDTQQMSATGSQGRTLLAVLANPPLTTSGQRTRDRVTLAAQFIGCEDVVVGNLFPLPSKDVTGIGRLGARPELWCGARADLVDHLSRVDDVLLGWGCREPAGEARSHHRSQIEWLLSTVVAKSVRIWTVGGLPRHPSRWQRYTAKVHPALSFSAALAISLAAPSDLSRSAPGGQ